tara:strand:+ start:196 stop:492 length:297 start_codon:yes stop_codon:yes gene_type:complete
MKQTVTESMFKDTIISLRPKNFTWGNLAHLYDYLVGYEDDCDTEIEFDPIGICCEFSEFINFNDFKDSYGGDFEDIEDIEVMTTVIEGDDDSFIIQDF